MLYKKIIGLALVSFPIAIGYLFPIGSLITHYPKISPIGKNKILDKIVSSPPRSNRIQTLALLGAIICLLTLAKAYDCQLSPRSFLSP